MSISKNILENLKKKYQQEYGVAVFEIKIKNTKSGVEINGKVLTENQRDEVLEEFKKNKINIKKENIKILSGAEKRNEIGWAIVKEKIIDLKSRFVSGKIINDKILNRIRCSQAFKDEILRVLCKHENQLLVQQSDLTLGWVEKDEITFNSPTPLIRGAIKKHLLDKGGGGVGGRYNTDFYKIWKKGNYALKNKVLNLKSILKCHPELISESVLDFKKNNAILINQDISGAKTKQRANQKKILKQSFDYAQDDKIRNKIIKEAEKYLGVKYVLGGKSKNGIDCSSLVQAAYKNSLGVILPKHSWDQKKIGKKIKLENVETGDLMFLIKKRNSHKHVGIVEICKNTKRLHINTPLTPLKRGIAATTSANLNLIHASLDEKKVVRQSLEEVFEKYNFVEARRVAE